MICAIMHKMTRIFILNQLNCLEPKLDIEPFQEKHKETDLVCIQNTVFKAPFT